MTAAERDARRAALKNANDQRRLMEQLEDKKHKRDCRDNALRIASQMKPYVSMVNVNQKEEKYDLLKEADKIYKWLIK